MQAERERALARADFRFWKDWHDGEIRQIEGNEKIIAIANKEIAEARANADKYALFAAQAARKLAEQ